MSYEGAYRFKAIRSPSFTRNAGRSGQEYGLMDPAVLACCPDGKGAISRSTNGRLSDGLPAKRGPTLLERTTGGTQTGYALYGPAGSLLPWMMDPSDAG